MVAPIALYPDQLLAQILSASTNPQEVLDGGNWLLQNQNLKGDALTNELTVVGGEDARPRPLDSARACST